jgi:large subunit ribosomal protein L15
VIVNLGSLEKSFAAGDVVDYETLVAKGLVKKTRKALLKVLGEGEITKALKVHAHVFSKSAAEAIQKHKGEVHIVAEES